LSDNPIEHAAWFDSSLLDIRQQRDIGTRRICSDLLHAHGYYLFVPYVGVLFYATVAGAAIVSWPGAWCPRVGLDARRAARSLRTAGYVASRTIGLPMFPVPPWQDPFGLASIVAEALFIILGVGVLRTPTRSVNRNHPRLVAELRGSHID
jgi:hypothetical protein